MEETLKKMHCNFIVNHNCVNISIISRNFQEKKNNQKSQNAIIFGNLPEAKGPCYSRKVFEISEIFRFFIIEPSPMVSEDNGKVLISQSNDKVSLYYCKRFC